MAEFATKHFGTIQYQDQAVFEFPAGLPGFEQERRFLAVKHPASQPIVFLQSLRCPELCFITLPVLVVDAGYRLAMSPEDARLLSLAEDRQPAIGSEVLCLAVISVGEGKLPTANLLAPIVVNLQTRQAVQAILENSAYSHQHPLLDSEAEKAC